MTQRTWSAWLGVLALFSALHVGAQDKTPSDSDIEAGRSHFKTGVDFYRDGDLSAALIEFKRAYAAAPNYRLLYNLGHVSYELREYVDAQRYLRRYLQEGGSEIEPARRQESEGLLAKLTGRIATLVLSSNVAGAEIFVDDVSVGHSPLSEPLAVSAGTRRLTAAVEGRPRVTRVLEAGGGDRLVVALEFPVEHDDRVTTSPPPAAASSSASSAAVWLGIGSGALAVGAGVMAYLAYSDGSNYREALGRKTTAHELDTLHDRATTKALVTDILLGAAVVTTVITLVVALQGGRSEERPTSTAAKQRPHAGALELSLGARSLGLRGHFE
jgi:hypothetical protein